MAEDMEIRPSPPKTPEPPAPIVGGKEGGKEGLGFFKEILKPTREKPEEHNEAAWIVQGFEDKELMEPNFQPQVKEMIEQSKEFEARPSKEYLDFLIAQAEKIRNLDESGQLPSDLAPRINNRILLKATEAARELVQRGKITPAERDEILAKLTEAAGPGATSLMPSGQKEGILPEEKDEREEALRAISTKGVKEAVDEIDRRIHQIPEGDLQDSRFWRDAWWHIKHAVEKASEGKPSAEKDRIEAEAYPHLEMLVERRQKIEREIEETMPPRFRLGLTENEWQRLMRPGGEREIFEELVTIAEQNPRVRFFESFGAIGGNYKLTDLYGYLREKFPERGLEMIADFQRELSIRSKIHDANRILVTGEGGIEGFIKAIGEFQSEDYDLITSTQFVGMAASLYEDELRNILARRRVKCDALNRREKAGEELSKEEELEWRRGVMVYDSDITANLKQLKEIERRNQAFLLREKRKGGEPLTSKEEIFLNETLADLKSRGIPEEKIELSPEEREILKRGRFSPIEAKVYEGLKTILEAQGRRLSEHELRKAVAMARNFNVITLRVPAIIALMGDLPSVKGGEELMISQPFEDILRIINRETWYWEKFSMGGGAGAAFRALLRGRKPEAGMFGEEWIDENRRKRAEVAEKLGFGFKEMFEGGILQIGGPFEVSMWRGKIGITDRVSEDVALGLRLAQEKDPTKKEKIWGKLSDREPLLIAQLFPQDRERIAQEHNIRWEILEKSLMAAQSEAVTAQMQEADFGKLLPKYLEKFGISPGQDSAYLGAVRTIQDLGKEKAKDLGNLTSPLTVTLSDVPWQETELLIEGGAGMNRRMRDNLSALKAGQTLDQIMLDIAPSSYEKHLERIGELKNALEGYHGVGEKTDEVMYRTARAILRFSQNKLRWIPGASTLGRMIPPSYEGVLEKVIQPVLEKARKFTPSEAIKELGPHAPAMDEFAISNFIDLMHRHGMFGDPKLYGRLKSELKANMFFQTLAFFRWAIPIMIAATIAQALKEETEKK